MGDQKKKTQTPRHADSALAAPIRIKLSIPGYNPWKALEAWSNKRREKAARLKRRADSAQEANSEISNPPVALNPTAQVVDEGQLSLPLGHAGGPP